MSDRKGGFHLLFSKNTVSEFVPVTILLNRGTPYFILETEGVQRILVIVSGSSYCLLRKVVSYVILECTSIKPFDA